MFAPWIMHCVEPWLEPYEWNYLHYPMDSTHINKLSESQLMYYLRHDTHEWDDSVVNLAIKKSFLTVLDFAFRKECVAYLFSEVREYITTLPALLWCINHTILPLDDLSVLPLEEMTVECLSYLQIHYNAAMRKIQWSTVWYRSVDSPKSHLIWLATFYLDHCTQAIFVRIANKFTKQELNEFFKDFQLDTMRIIKEDYEMLTWDTLQWMYERLTYTFEESKFILKLESIVNKYRRPCIYIRMLAERHLVEFNQRFILACTTVEDFEWMQSWIGPVKMQDALQYGATIGFDHFDSVETYEWVVNHGVKLHYTAFECLHFTPSKLFSTRFRNKQHFLHHLTNCHLSCDNYLTLYYHCAIQELQWIIEIAEERNETLYNHSVTSAFSVLPHRYIRRFIALSPSLTQFELVGKLNLDKLALQIVSRLPEI